SSAGGNLGGDLRYCTFPRADPTGHCGAKRLIPVSLVTGFLGSGKTSFIRRVLTQPGFGRTAVIVNEFGEISLDHDLIASSDDKVLTLTTGCLCCAVQTDLARTLMDLAERRKDGAVYDRVLIETSGLGNPGPMIQAMLTDRQVAGSHRVDRIVTLVDSVFGDTTLADHAEAREQVALADHILISKEDLKPLSTQLHGAIRASNPTAEMQSVSAATAETLFGSAAVDRQVRPALPAIANHREIETFTLVRDQPLPALALTLLLQAIAEHCGSRLLRLKGLVALEEMPGRPAVIHGVHHVFSAPEFLDRWPSADQTTRIVFIGRGIPRYFVHRLLSAIEDEVREAAAG
ncbi:MAG TPA: GTP-binding protein, partial [Rhodopila sp.]|nr:GTP-binding protein [Rhodopila sp.]